MRRKSDEREWVCTQSRVVVAMTAQEAAQETAGRVPQEWQGDSIAGVQRRYVTISDGLGGILHLDLLRPGLDDLARACNALLAGMPLPPGACLMRVAAGDDTYLLRRVKAAPTSIGILRLVAQGQGVSLNEDVLRLVMGLIERTRHLRPSPEEPGRQRSDD